MNVRTRRLLVLAVSVLLMILFSYSRRYGYCSGRPEAAQLQVNERVLFRVNSSNRAGLGSLIAQLHSAFLMSEILGVKLHIIRTWSELFDYDIADLLNSKQDQQFMRNPDGPVCSLEHIYGPNDIHTLNEMLYRWCETHELDDQMQVLRNLTATCSIIIDDRPWHMDARMFSCTWGWLRNRLQPPTKRITDPTVSVGGAH